MTIDDMKRRYGVRGGIFDILTSKSERERGREGEREGGEIRVSCAVAAAHEKRERYALSRARDGERRLVGVRATEGASRKSEKTGVRGDSGTVRPFSRTRDYRHVRRAHGHSLVSTPSNIREYVSLHGDHVPERDADNTSRTPTDRRRHLRRSRPFRDPPPPP